MSKMSQRREVEKFQGVMTIVRFNWPFYAVAAVVLLGASVVAYGAAGWWQAAGALVFCGVGWLVMASLTASYLAYDRSGIFQGEWLRRAMDADECQGRYIFAHSGYDDGVAFRKCLPTVNWTVIDHYEPQYMTEASIHRARKLFPPEPGTLAVPFDPFGHWPLADGLADAVLGMLAVHELRSEAHRTSWFHEARRCMRKGGRVIVVEHLRDLPNFIAFGPGAFHFHSFASWRRCWEAAGLTLHKDFTLTPWLRVMILKEP